MKTLNDLYKDGYSIEATVTNVMLVDTLEPISEIDDLSDDKDYALTWDRTDEIFNDCKTTYELSDPQGNILIESKSLDDIRDYIKENLLK